VRPTVVEVTARGDAVTCVLDGDAVIPRLVHRRGHCVEIALVSGRAMLMPGDHVELDVRVGDGCSVRLVDIGGLIIYGREEVGQSQWHAHLDLGADAHLVWEGLPTVVTDAGSLTRSMTVRLGAAASVVARETLVLGRSGERGGALTADVEVTDAAGPVLRERLQVRGDQPCPGILGSQRVVDSVLYLGEGITAPHVPGAVRLDLERGGAVLRYLGDHAHDSPLESLLPLGTALRFARSAIDDAPFVPHTDTGRGDAGRPRLGR
tara:strand:- start:357 stop:1148 length:792 start_codon:yes stop_codon:yes gene_type:complete